MIPKAIGPYSSHRKVGNLIITSGQIPINPETNTIESENIEDQVAQSLDNVKAILKSEGLTMNDIIKTTVLFSDLADFAKANEVYATYFDQPYPARMAYEVAKLPMNAKIEIEVIAEIK